MLYTHDCNTCIYLGSSRVLDFYVHTGSGETYIARYSSDGPAYTSGKAFVGIDPHITLAHHLATAQGLALDGVGTQ